MSYTSNMGAVIDKLNVQLKGIKKQDPLLRDIAVSLATLNVDRIHTEGKDVSGSNITNKPSRKTPTMGAYSRSYAKLRQKPKSGSAKQISKVDLSFTGKLSTEFQAGQISDGWGVGFISSYGSNLFKLLTDKYGDVWGITASDNRAIGRIVSKEIKKKLGT